MTVYVYRDGKIVEKTYRDSVKPYRFTEYQSPITGALITSSRQRERDLNNSGSFDPRDLPKDHQWKRGRQEQSREAHAARSGPNLWR